MVGVGDGVGETDGSGDGDFVTLGDGVELRWRTACWSPSVTGSLRQISMLRWISTQCENEGDAEGEAVDSSDGVDDAVRDKLCSEGAIDDFDADNSSLNWIARSSLGPKCCSTHPWTGMGLRTWSRTLWSSTGEAATECTPRR
jgi:hypothetical protein